MKLNEIQAAIEAILFVSGEAVPLTKLAQAVGVNKRTVASLIKNMMEEYKKENRGIQIIEIEGSYQLCTKAQCFEYIQSMFKDEKKSGLSQAALEVLAIIAYKQPLTRAEVEAIRGVNSDWAINKLLEKQLIKEVGRMDAPGKPILYGTTEEFLRSFGFKSIHELPNIEEDSLETNLSDT